MPQNKNEYTTTNAIIGACGLFAMVDAAVDDTELDKASLKNNLESATENIKDVDVKTDKVK